MSVTLTVNGTGYTFPQKGESPNSSPAVDWGNTVTAWATAITAGMLQKAGGAFTLTAEVDFGASFGLKSLYFKTRSTPIATAGQFRMARTDVLSWRNQADAANLDLAVNASNQLTFNGSVLAVGTGDVAGPGSSTDNAVARFDSTTGKIIQDTANCSIEDSGEITSQSLTASRALVASSGKRIQSSTVTDVELAYLSGAFGPANIRADDLRIALEFDTTDLAAASTTDVFAKIINQGAIINAISLSTADVAVGHFDSTNKKFGAYSYACGSGRAIAFPARSGPKYTGSLSAWYRSLTAGDYVAFNRLLGIEVYLDASGFQTTKVTKRTAATDSTKNTSVVVGSNNRAGDATFRSVTSKWRCNDAGGASTDFLQQERDAVDEGTQLSAQDIDINPGDCGNWIIGAKKNDPATWDHFYAANGAPTAHASPWTSVGTPNATVSNGILNIATTASNQGNFAKTGAPLAGLNLANETIEFKLRVNSTDQRTSVAVDAMAAVFIRDDSMDRGFVLEFFKTSIFLRESNSATVSFECQIDTSQFHIYRLTTSGATNPIPKLYINDVLVFTGAANTTADATANDSIEFGDINVTASHNSNTDWEWFAFADEVAAPVAGNASGNIDSIGLTIGTISDSTITALQTYKISDVFRNLPSYGPTLPLNAIPSRGGAATTASTTFVAVATGMAYYVAGDGVTEYSFSMIMDHFNGTVPSGSFGAIDVNSDIIGITGSATGPVSYGGSVIDHVTATKSFPLSLSRKVVLPVGLSTVTPTWCTTLGTIGTSESFWMWERQISRNERLQ